MIHFRLKMRLPTRTRQVFHCFLTCAPLNNFFIPVQQQQAFVNSEVLIHFNLHCVERYLGEESLDTWSEFKNDYKVYREK